MSILTRHFFNIGAFVIASVPSAGIAQTNDQPTANERRAITSCIDRSVRNNRPHLRCIGAVSRPCINKPGNSSTVGMKLCLNREASVWDQLLNENYQNIRKSITPKGAKLLTGIQRTWIKWRAAKCSLGYARHEGGTLAGVVANDCYASTTALRAIEFPQALGQAGTNPLGMNRGNKDP
jgi:uncharacterized protein YecT (DUF1311 family)